MSCFNPATKPETRPAAVGPDPLIWSRRRKDLRDWFRREAPSLGPAYEAAVEILHMEKMPARVPLVCHLVRDIYNRLPEILDREYRRQQAGEVYPALVSAVETHFKSTMESFSSESERAPGSLSEIEHVEVPVAAVRAVQSLLEKYREVQEQPTTDQALTRFLYDRYAEAGRAVPERLVAKFKQQRQWFTARAHLTKDEGKSHSEEGLKDHFLIFENTIYSLVGPYFPGKKIIDDVLNQTNQAAG